MLLFRLALVRQSLMVMVRQKLPFFQNTSDIEGADEGGVIGQVHRCKEINNR